MTTVFAKFEVIHLVRTHEGERGASNSLRHAYKGEGVDIFKYVRKKVPFCTYFLIFHMQSTMRKTSGPR